jgi:hypothetical protein
MWRSTLLIMLSAYILLLSILPKFAPDSSMTILGQRLDFLVFSASLVLLVLTIFLAFDDDRVRAQGLFDNAWRIGTIYHEYKHALKQAKAHGGAPPSGTPFFVRYREALEACKFRHDPIDHAATEIMYAKEDKQPIGWRGSLYFLEYFVNVFAWPALVILIPLVGITIIPQLVR